MFNSQTEDMKSESSKQSKKELIEFSFISCEANDFEAKLDQMLDDYDNNVEQASDEFSSENSVNDSAEQDFYEISSDEGKNEYQEEEEELIFSIEINNNVTPTSIDEGKNEYQEVEDELILQIGMDVNVTSTSITKQKTSPTSIATNIDSPVPMIAKNASEQFLYDNDATIYARPTNQNHASFFSKKLACTSNLFLKVRDGYVNEETSYLCKVAKEYSFGASFEAKNKSVVIENDQKSNLESERDIDDLFLESLGDADMTPFFPSSYFNNTKV